MKKYFDPKLNRVIYEIHAGEVASTTNRQAVMTTLLGSCVSVCLVDWVNQVFGINHFMLPGRLTARPGEGFDPKYGTYATDLLIRAMLRKGAVRERLEAKVFGAGKVMESTVINVAWSNADFIQRYLKALGIPILASDLGKDYGRKILFFCHSGEVFVKKVTDIRFALPGARIDE